MNTALDRVAAAIPGWLSENDRRPLVVGVCGAQGSGKSTLAAGLRDRLTARGLRVAILSLDDLYLNGARRDDLAATLHPLLRTRGVPLTHDAVLGTTLIRTLRARRTVCFPRFDKARDEPLPIDLWDETSPPDILVFEGWCMGARPEDEAALTAPVNALERDEDGDGRWRRAVNAALADRYADLFGEIDRLVLQAAPGFAVVRRWRLEQEEDLRCRITAAGGDTRGLMDAAAIDRFVQHYERLTRWILAEMPARADLVVPLDETRSVRRQG